MAFEIKKQTRINSSPEKIWNILINTREYPKWNPFIKSVKGELKEGNKIEVILNGMKFKPTVLTFKDTIEFKWLGHLLVKGIFDGEHKFKLIKNADGTTTFEQSEVFKGFLVPFLKKKLEKDIAPLFDVMNKAVKMLAEAQKEEIYG